LANSLEMPLSGALNQTETTDRVIHLITDSFPWFLCAMFFPFAPVR